MPHHADMTINEGTEELNDNDELHVMCIKDSDSEVEDLALDKDNDNIVL